MTFRPIPPPAQARDVLNALAERCEAAAGPDRELDRDILKALYPDAYIGDYAGYEDIVFHARPLVHDKDVLPYFTDSFDAAILLLGQFGVLLFLSDIGADGLPMARVGRPDLDDVPIFTGISTGGTANATITSSLALALCAAALRAQAR